MNKELLQTYYDLFDILESIECVASAIKELTHSRDSMSMIIQSLEYTRLWHYEEELNLLYDMKMDDLRAFRVKKMKCGTQTTFEDFM